MKFKVETAANPTRLDRCLAARFPDRSRSAARRLIENGGVTLNGEINRVPKTIVKPGDEIEAEFPPKEPTPVTAEDVPLSILHEDEFLLVVDKPAGMIVHPAAGVSSGTLVNALMGRAAEFADLDAWDDGGEWPRPGIVHRLDRDTSGCLVVAKTPAVRKRLVALFAGREVRKTYLALVSGYPKPETGELATPFGRHPVNRKKMAVLPEGGRMAVTRYETLAKGEIDGIPVAALGVRILTGRTHQIRVHLAHLKTPVLGDPAYGGRQRISFRRQMLHARRLVLPHPETGAELDVESPPPDDIVNLLDRLGGADR